MGCIRIQYIIYIIHVSIVIVVCAESIDLMVEFMISHMAKNFKLDLYRYTYIRLGEGVC